MSKFLNFKFNKNLSKLQIQNKKVVNLIKNEKYFDLFI